MKYIQTRRRVLLAVAAGVVSLISTWGGVAAQVPDWTMLLGGAGAEVGYSVATDYDGSVVVTGSFEGETNIAGARLTSAGYTDVFIAKFSRSGSLLWATSLGGASSDQPGAVAIDKETGDVVVTGRFSATATVHDQVLQSVGTSDVFLARFSKSGSLQWALAFGSAADDVAAGVAVDPNGDSLVTGHFSGQFICGHTALTSMGGTDIFIAKVSLDGMFQWCRRLGGSSDDSAGGIAVDDAGLLALTGTFATSTDLGGGTVSSAGQFDAFVASYAVADGSHRWARRMGGSGYDGGNAVAFDTAGAVVVSGYFGLFGGGVDFGGGVLASNGGADAFVAKYDSADGGYVWANTFGGSLDDYANAISVDPDGDIIVAGEFQGLVVFAGVSASSGGQFDAYLARLSSSGAPLWWRSYGDIVNDKATSVTVDVEGNYYVTGFSIFRIDLGRGALHSAGMADAFLAKLAPPVTRTPTPTRTFTRTLPPPTPTFTATLPPATRTFTATLPPATRTFTATLPPPTPTFTATLPPATRTFTPTLPPPTPTFTATLPPPTSTFTQPPPSSFTPTPTDTARGCTVDCNNDGTVTVDELVAGINIVLGHAALSTCGISDANDDGMVTINEVVTAVRSALTECPRRDPPRSRTRQSYS